MKDKNIPNTLATSLAEAGLSAGRFVVVVVVVVVVKRHLNTRLPLPDDLESPKGLGLGL